MVRLNLLVTGKPGVGKTTLVERIVKRLSSSLRLAGFTMGEMSNPTGEKRVVGLRVSVSNPFHSPSPFTLNRSFLFSNCVCAWS